MHGHLDIVQDELDTLKDLLRSDVYSLDHSTLLGVSCLPIISGQDEANLAPGSKQNLNNPKITNANANPNNAEDDEDIDQTRYKILQFLNDSIFNELD